MITILFKLSHAEINLISKPVISSKSINYVHAHFDLLTDDWNGVITVLFKRIENVDSPSYEVVLDQNGNCKVPWEVLQEEGHVQVSAYCGDLHTSTICEFNVTESGYTKGDASTEPTPDKYTQLIKLINTKQDKLIPGDNIHIDNNRIYADSYVLTEDDKNYIAKLAMSTVTDGDEVKY